MSKPTTTPATPRADSGERSTAATRPAAAGPLKSPGRLATPARPGATQPGLARPGTARSGATRSGTAQPGTARSGTAQPGAARSAQAWPGVARTSAGRPGAVQPGTPQRGAARPGAVQPGTPPRDTARQGLINSRYDGRPAREIDIDDGDRWRDTRGPSATRPPWGPPQPSRPPWNGALAAAEPGEARRRPLSPSARRMYARRRRTMVLAFLLLVVVVLTVGRIAGRDERHRTAVVPPAADTATSAPTAASAGPSSASPSSAGPSSAGPSGSSGGGRTTDRPRTAGGGAGTFDHARGIGPLLGSGGTLRRFRVAVENGQGLDSTAFADAVNRILGDPRSWTAGGRLSLQRVPRGEAAEFTVYLASAATSERMCAAGGLETARYTSCRLRGQVIINLDRWRNAVPDYDAPLDVYQAYAVNHEVGHQLGHGHEACPGAGQPAPVMQQQTYGLKGCTANAWPYLDGERHVGEPVP